MKKFERQFNLFNNNDVNFSKKNSFQDIDIDKKVIIEWQKKIIDHQSPLFKSGCENINQASLFGSISEKVTLSPIA